MFKRVLVPVDFTHKNEAAIEVARELAARDQATLTLIHVVETIDQMAGDDFASFYKRLVKKATAQLAGLAEPLASEGLDVQQRIIVGKPLAELLRETSEQAIDLVVVSSHRIEMQPAAGSWATLSYQLSVLCPCPVLLVK